MGENTVTDYADANAAARQQALEPFGTGGGFFGATIRDQLNKQYDALDATGLDPNTPNDIVRKNALTRSLGGKVTADNLALEAAYKEEKRYQDTYRPLNQELMAEKNSTAIMDSARKTLSDATDAADARRRRQLGRYGVTETAYDTVENRRRNKISDALNNSATMGAATLAQHERNEALRNELINMGRGISQSGHSGLSEAASMETQRRNQQAMAEAQHDAAKTQMIGTGTGLLLMYLLGL